jgi:hypothetical protein
MNKTKFKNKYEPEWETLSLDKDFMMAFDADNFDEAARIAASICHGHAGSMAEHRKLKFDKYIREEYV